MNMAPAGPNISPWMTRAEAAEWARCSISKLDVLMQRGELTRYRFGRDVLIRREELESMIKRAVPGRPAVEHTQQVAEGPGGVVGAEIQPCEASRSPGGVVSP